jgi:hypothetical protein
VDVCNVGNGRKLRHKEEAGNHGKGGQNGRLTSSHGITVCKASASLVFHTRKIAYEGDGTLFIQIPVATTV